MSRRGRAALLALPLAALLCCARLADAAERSAAGGLPTTLCAGVATEPRFAFGVAWSSPVASAIPPLMLTPYRACLTVPSGWLTPLPNRHAGQWSVP